MASAASCEKRADKQLKQIGVIWEAFLQEDNSDRWLSRSRSPSLNFLLKSMWDVMLIGRKNRIILSPLND